VSDRRYVVVGGGAVGGALAAQLVPAGHDVVLVARGEHGRLAAERGLTVRRPTGVDVVRPEVASGPSHVRLRADDVLLLTTKAQDAEAALVEWAWQPVEGGGLAVDLPIVTFQNGLATEDLALRRFARVYGATIAIAASFTTPGEIVSPSLPPAVGAVWLGRYPSGLDDLARSVVTDLSEAGFRAEAVVDVRVAKAAKLLGNVGNGLDLIEGDDAWRAETRRALRDEAVAVLDAAGIAPPDWTLDLSASGLEVLPVEGHVPGRLSTWQSFARGTSSEIDYLNGEIVLLARKHGLEAPANEHLQRHLATPPRFGG
jgi:2-dehydropantoate 2-reductase